MGESPMIPAEVVEQLRRFHESIMSTEDALDPFLSQKPEDRLKLTTLEQARCNLLSVFAINSFYWILLRLKGMSPKESESLSNELKRTKDYMARLKNIEERTMAPRLNQRAAAGFVRNALWEPKERTVEVEAQREEEEEEEEEEEKKEKEKEDRTVAMKNNSQQRTDNESPLVEGPRLSELNNPKRPLPHANSFESVVAKKMKSEISDDG